MRACLSPAGRSRLISRTPAGLLEGREAAEGAGPDDASCVRMYSRSGWAAMRRVWTPDPPALALAFMASLILSICLLQHVRSDLRVAGELLAVALCDSATCYSTREQRLHMSLHEDMKTSSAMIKCNECGVHFDIQGVISGQSPCDQHPNLPAFAWLRHPLLERLPVSELIPIWTFT